MYLTIFKDEPKLQLTCSIFKILATSFWIKLKNKQVKFHHHPITYL